MNKNKSKKIDRLLTVSIAGFCIFLIIPIALHFIHSDFDPTQRFVSEFIFGSKGWLLNFAFTSNLIACFSFTYAFYLAYRPENRTVIELICLGISTLSVITNYFPTDLHGKAKTLSGHIHNLGAFFGTIAFIVFLFVFVFKLYRLKLVSGINWLLPFLTILAPISFTILLYVATSHPEIVGIIQRVFIVNIMGAFILSAVGIKSGKLVPA